MSILIKGAKMPEGCQKCKCLRKSVYVCGLDYDYTCLLGAKQIPMPWHEQLHNRADDCPLIEIPPHGRLIDADVFEEMLNSEGGVELKNVPTVIESEEE